MQVTTWLVFLPPDVPARGWDLLRVTAGPHTGVYELSGDPWPVESPAGGVTAEPRARRESR